MPVITPGQYVSLHSGRGVQMYQWQPSDQQTLTWARQLRDVSKATLALGNLMTDDEKFPDIYPWVHHLSIWSGDWTPKLYWTGPIQKVTANRFGGSINASDISAYLAKTRCPMTKAWNAVDPCIPAGELWNEMISLQDLTANPVIREDPWGDHFNVNTTADSEMLDKTIKTLEQYGLRWTVIAGTPLLGPMPYQPIASLGEKDFVGDDGISLIRDGTATANDVLLRGTDNIARARVDLADLNLQSIVNIDNMFGVSNTIRATQQYVRQTGMIKTDIDVPSNAVFHPDANVSIDQLVPSARFAVEAYGVRLRMELESIQVSASAAGSQIAPTFNEVQDWTEIGQLQSTVGSSLALSQGGISPDVSSP